MMFMIPMPPMTREIPAMAVSIVIFGTILKAKTHLVQTGYDPSYGARPLKRAIQREIENPLGRMILEGKVRDGQTVVVDYDAGRGQLTFTAR